MEGRRETGKECEINEDRCPAGWRERKKAKMMGEEMYLCEIFTSSMAISTVGAEIRPSACPSARQSPRHMES